jgi:hypothetical protein
MVWAKVMDVIDADISLWCVLYVEYMSGEAWIQESCDVWVMGLVQV